MSKKRVSKENFENKSVFCGVLSYENSKHLGYPCLIGWLEINPENKEELIQYAGIFGLMPKVTLTRERRYMSKKYNQKEIQRKKFAQILEDLDYVVLNMIKGGCRFYPLFSNELFADKILEAYAETITEIPGFDDIQDSILRKEDELTREIMGGESAGISKDKLILGRNLKKFKLKFFEILRY